LKAVSCIDLTTLSGDDTEGRVRRLCAKAKRPVREDILNALGAADLALTTGAVCVYHGFIETAVDALKGTDIEVAAVSTGSRHLKRGSRKLKPRLRRGRARLILSSRAAMC